MHAIIETGGKQYKVTEGDTLFIEKLPNEAGDAITFDKVLAVIDGDNATFGTPVVAGAKVEANVVKNGKGKKIMVFKYKPKKGYRRKQGHRQRGRPLCRHYQRCSPGRVRRQRRAGAGGIGQGAAEGRVHLPETPRQPGADQ